MRKPSADTRSWKASSSQVMKQEAEKHPCNLVSNSLLICTLNCSGDDSSHTELGLRAQTVSSQVLKQEAEKHPCNRISPTHLVFAHSRARATTARTSKSESELGLGTRLSGSSSSSSASDRTLGRIAAVFLLVYVYSCVWPSVTRTTQVANLTLVLLRVLKSVECVDIAVVLSQTGTRRLFALGWKTPTGNSCLSY